MAVKTTTLGGTDWIDGDVLSAADQNDTIERAGNINTFMENFLGTTEDSQIWTIVEANGATSEIEQSRIKLITGTTGNAECSIKTKGTFNLEDYSKVIIETRYSLTPDPPVDMSTESASDNFIKKAIGVTSTAADPNGVYAMLVWDTGSDWKLVTKDGTTEERSAAFTIDFSTERKVRFEITTSEVKLYIDDSLIATNDSNVPTGTANLYFNLGLLLGGSAGTSHTLLGKFVKIWFIE